MAEEPDYAAEVEQLREEVAQFQSELAEARVTGEYLNGTVAALRAILQEARAATRRPAGLDGRCLIIAAATPECRSCS